MSIGIYRLWTGKIIEVGKGMVRIEAKRFKIELKKKRDKTVLRGFTKGISSRPWILEGKDCKSILSEMLTMRNAVCFWQQGLKGKYIVREVFLRPQWRNAWAQQSVQVAQHLRLSLEMERKLS